MENHTCFIDGCKGIVIRDTEGHCSRHRAKKYHQETKHRRKAKQMKMFFNENNVNDRVIYIFTFVCLFFLCLFWCLID